MNNEQRTKIRVRRGVTLTELVIAAVIGLIVILAVGVALAGSVRGWQMTYDRVNSDVMVESYTARRAFDAIIRRACRQKFLLGEGGESLEVYYYASGTSSSADRYARFYYLSGDNKLMLELGIYPAKSPTGTVTICSNVASCNFKVDGRSVQMLLTLDSGTQQATVVTSAVLHNPG